MRLNEYQEAAAKFAAYENEEYPFFALAEETGEFLGLVAKGYRGDDLVARFGSIEKVREAFVKEAGDILWQLCACLGEMEITLDEVALLNLKKLTDRKNRGVIKGSGDDR